MRSKLWLILLSLALAQYSLSEPLGDKVLTPEDFVRRAIAHHPGVQKLFYEYREKTSIQKQSGALKDFLLSSKLDYTYTGPLDKNGVLTGEKSDSLGFAATLSKKFPSLLGMNASLSAGYSSVSGQNYTSGQEIRQYQPTLGAAITLPLLKNFLGLLDLNTLKNMEQGLQMLKYSQEEALELWLSGLYATYQEWALAYQKVKLYNEIKDRSALILAQTQRKSRYKIADESDLVLARENFLKYQSLVLGAIKDEQKQYLYILSYLGQTKPESRYEPLWDTKGTQIPVPNPPGPESLRIIRLAKLQLEYQNTRLASATSDLKPSLDLELQYRQNGGGDNGGDSFKYLNQNEFYVGFLFSMPLENTDKKNAHRASVAALGKVQKEYEELALAVSTELSQIADELKSQSAILKLNEERVKLSAYRVELMTGRYGQSRVTLKELTDVRDTYASTLMSYLEEQNTYQKKLLEYKTLSDQLDLSVLGPE